MDKTQFNELSKRYSALVQWLIETNIVYSNIDTKIRWTFAWDGNLAIAGTTDRRTNIISLNIEFVDRAYRENRIYDIEYFILHELRHVAQHIQIEKIKTGKNTIDPAFINKWAEEEKNYIKSLDEFGNENPEYFKQDCEMDAYAFSYAVMQHKYYSKYGSKLFLPSIYKNELKIEFDSAVTEFLGSFSY